MPKEDVDYSNTIIYKIYCKDETITDVYVGYTTNFTQRKYSHKIACNNMNNNLKIYEIIRSNGGWENWDMIEIAKYCCKDVTEARIKEQEHYKDLKTSINVIPSYLDKKNYYCFTCNIQCQTPNHYKRHIELVSHKNKENNAEEQTKNEVTIISNGESIISNDFLPNSCFKFYCNFCDYGTCKKSSYDEHLSTKKHNKSIFVNKNLPKTCSEYVCQICNKKYKDNSGLWRHKKICTFIEDKNIDDVNIESDCIKHVNNDPSDKELIMLLIKENTEMRNIMMKVIENGTHNTTNNTTTHTNSHNKAFNLNFFLNETCKNAMNITDFVDSIKLQMSDLMDVGELGYVEGISKIIVKNLNNLDETERPIHCTDKKRETFYIKDQDKWEKEDEEKKKIKDTIKTIANKNIRLLPQFREKFPDYNNSSSKTSDKYEKIVIEAMVCDIEKDEKIIKNISKVTGITKNN